MFHHFLEFFKGKSSYIIALEFFYSHEGRYVNNIVTAMKHKSSRSYIDELFPQLFCCIIFKTNSLYQSWEPVIDSFYHVLWPMYATNKIPLNGWSIDSFMQFHVIIETIIKPTCSFFPCWDKQIMSNCS